MNTTHFEHVKPFADSENLSLMSQVSTWMLLPVMLWYAGVTIYSSQDTGFGDMLTNYGGGRQQYIFAVLTQLAGAVLALILMFPQFWRIVRALLQRRMVLATVVLPFASVMWSQQPKNTLHGSLFLLLSIMVALWLPMRFTTRQLMEILMVVGACAALLSIIAALGYPSIGLDSRHDDAWQGVFYSKNHMGRIFVFLLTPAFHYLPSGSAKKAAKYVYIALVLLMIILSESRGAWLATGVYLTVAAAFGLVRRFGARDRISVLVMTGVCAVLVGAVVAILFTQLMFLIGRDATLDGRTIIWGVLMHSVVKRPLLGYGYQAFWAGTSSEGMNAFMGVYLQTHFMASYAHSGYFSVLLEDGLVGMALISFIIFAAFRNGWICLQRQPQSEIVWYIGLIILTIIYNIDEVTFMQSSYLPWMMFIVAVVGLADAAARDRLEKTKRGPASGEMQPQFESCRA